MVKFNELLANCAIYSTALDITDVANGLAAEGFPVDTDDLATITPYIQHTIRRMGDLVLNLSPPEEAPVSRLDLEPRVLLAEHVLQGMDLEAWDATAAAEIGAASLAVLHPDLLPAQTRRQVQAWLADNHQPTEEEPS